ncbi:Trp operon repressor [Bisgaardia hudsonensis]|uniref:Trp operon repressor homolog n=1 Tax=Bisgaardia hudsonensis TaxID=109472 RepID=A0A4R2N391_9PAST|nr:trp operon repressor [Bisgaardia hudsonensis]QLB12845.1 Trp operon repressor [Bisgaardia hudsonensis]TCP14404.1 Trp operon repressor [Bisgaardia hudsonensis]
MYVSRNMDHWQDFMAILNTAFEQGKGQDLLTLLLTADERDAVGLRLQIVDQLLNGNIPQREIQQNLNTSAATITRGSNMIKMMPPDFMQWIKEQLNEQKKNKEK